MNRTLCLLAASTAIAAALGLPAFSAITDPFLSDGRGDLAAAQNQPAAAVVTLASNDDDDDEGHEEDDDEDDDGDCEEDDDECGPAAGPTPAGTVAPPPNGLFGTGAPPVVQVN